MRVLLVDSHVVARPVEHLGGGQPRGTGTHHGHSLGPAHSARLGRDVTAAEALLDDGQLDLADVHRRADEAQHAGALAGSGADAPGELRKDVGGEEQVERLFPVTVVHGFVELGDDVAERAAGARPVAEGGAAVHAARSLLVDLASVSGTSTDEVLQPLRAGR